MAELKTILVVVPNRISVTDGGVELPASVVLEINQMFPLLSVVIAPAAVELVVYKVGESGDTSGILVTTLPEIRTFPEALMAIPSSPLRE
jgi:hypothetical protein